ncbi:MAG: RNA polymerase factor sigma-54 [Polyangiales bacterium]
MEIKQQLKLSQHLVMTPQLQQAIRLLQLNQLELRDEISHELENNPVLADELTDPKLEKGEGADATLRGTNLSGEERVGVTEVQQAPTSMEERQQEKQVAEVDWEQFLENRTQQQALPTNRGGFEELPPIEQNLTKIESLEDHLLWQVQNSDFNDEERNFAELVIGNLDDRGFLDLKGVEREDGTRTPDMNVEDLATEAGLIPGDAEEVLKLLQQMDPVGVCCRDLRECLRVQAELYGYDDTEIAIIDRHLHNVEKRNWGAIAKDLKVSPEEVIEAAKQIQKLESRPARNFTTTDEKSIAITPDVYVMRDSDKWVVVDNDKGLQRLYINESLAKRLLKDPQAKEFIGEKLRNAQWLIRAIEQRRKTIIRVTECIVEKQKDFFEKGVAYLKPMILRDVAETVGMHESTISRVTTNKYVHTPQGLFELKYFFNSAIRRTADEDIASEAVKQAIKKLIDGEDKENPLSDQAIVELLERNEGIQIARRTVAKYREVMGILASSKRKKMF